MLDYSYIRTLCVDGVEKSGIRIGESNVDMPRHLMQGEKKSGMIISKGNISPWYWEGMVPEGGYRYIYFPKLELSSLKDLSSLKRSHALEIVRNIAIGLNSASSDFLNLETGIFPLYRIFIVNDADVLLLPPDVGNILSLTLEPVERQKCVNHLIKPSAEKGYLLILEMAELLYYALSGYLPYADEDTRRARYKEFPVSDVNKVLDAGLDEKTLGFISVSLGAKAQQMRDIMGNGSAEKALSWFIKNTEDLAWNLRTEQRKVVKPKVKGSLAYIEYKEKTEKKAKFNNFMRIKGTAIIISVVVILAVILIAGDYIKNLLAPPTTKDYDQEEIVAYVYRMQNELNAAELSTCTKGTKMPQENEVTNLFVTTRVREAYEFKTVVVPADRWVAEGKPAIQEGQMVYGVSEYEIERLDDDTLVAYFTLLTPYEYFNGEEEQQETDIIQEELYVYEYRIAQTFDFEWNDRGWWNIVDSEFSTVEFVGKEVVETTPAQRQLPTT